jgi:hypothetical protein
LAEGYVRTGGTRRRDGGCLAFLQNPLEEHEKLGYVYSEVVGMAPALIFSFKSINVHAVARIVRILVVAEIVMEADIGDVRVRNTISAYPPSSSRSIRKDSY